MESRVIVLEKGNIKCIQAFENSEGNSTILLNENIETREIELRIPSGQQYREYYIEDNILKLMFDH